MYYVLQCYRPVTCNLTLTTYDISRSVQYCSLNQPQCIIIMSLSILLIKNTHKQQLKKLKNEVGMAMPKSAQTKQ